MNLFTSARKEMKRSRKEMAALIGVPLGTWKNLEAGRDARRPVYSRAVEMLLIIHRRGLMMTINPLRFYVRMTPNNKFAVFDSFKQYDIGVFVEYDDANDFRTVLIEREKRNQALTVDSEMAIVNSTTQENSS